MGRQSTREIQSFEELFAGSARRRAGAAELFGEDDLDVIPVLDASLRRVSLYPRINLGADASAPALTGIFVPKSFAAGAKINAILYLHGHRAPNIYEYWNRSRTRLFALREELNLTGKSIVLIAPSLGPQSQAGWLAKDGGLDRYLDLVKAELAKSVDGISASTPWGNLVLASHSGGGLPMLRIATGQNTLGANITQVWGFDCLYRDSDVPDWLAWANRGGHRVYIYYGNGGTATRAKDLWREARRQFLANVNVWVDGSESTQHDEVPLKYWRERIEALP